MRRDQAKALELVETEMRRRGYSAGHSRQLVKTARAMLAMVARRPIARIDRLDVERYLAARVKAGCGASMPARECSMLHVFFTVLTKHELIEQVPTKGLVVEEPDAAPPVVLSENSVARLLAATLEVPASTRRFHPRFSTAVALRDRALVELLYAVGLRDAEARAARVVDLDLEDGSLMVRAVKRGRWRRVPLPPSALRAIKTYLEDARPLFVRGRSDPGHLLLSCRATALTQGATYGIVRTAARRAGLRAHPHAFRRAIATHLIRASVTITAVQQLLGHSQLSSTARYLAIGREDLRRTVEMLEDGTAHGKEPS